MSSNLDHWNDPDVESMYDKNLLKLEIESIKNELDISYEILDVGCGEGEGTVEYAKLVSKVHAIDFSPTRLEKAKKNCAEAGVDNVQFDQVDMLDDGGPGHFGSRKTVFCQRKYDAIVCQRFLINLPSWEAQQKVILELFGMLKPRGKLILLEGSQKGAWQLDQARELLGLDPIPIKWHNVFIDDNKLFNFVFEHGFSLRHGTGFGSYFIATRLFAPRIDANHKWDSVLNEKASTLEFEKYMRFDGFCSRLKLWICTR